MGKCEIELRKLKWDKVPTEIINKIIIILKKKKQFLITRRGKVKDLKGTIVL